MKRTFRTTGAIKAAAVRAAALLLTVGLLFQTGCAPATDGAEEPLNGWQPEKSLTPTYARGFAVDYYPGGYKLITIGDGSRFLTVPQGAEAPAGIAPDIALLQEPVEDIYLVATSAMCLFDALDGLANIRLSGTKAEGWYSAAARTAMEEGRILFAGKYSDPDYELILSEGTSLSIQSTMIDHTPGVKEKLEELGIPVLIDRSSYENHPLGRTEWIKLYGALLGKEALADSLFAQQEDYLNQANLGENTGRTVAFFHISTSGYAVARKSGDYVTRMLELAGGNYVFEDLGDPETATSTVTLEMESFYAGAKDADILIYNSTLGGELESLAQLLEKNPLLADFKAVREGEVWCTGKNLFQETTKLGQMILEFRQVFSGEASEEELEFLYRLR